MQRGLLGQRLCSPDEFEAKLNPDLTPTSRTPQNPNLANGQRFRGLSGQPSFRSRSCHWPKVTILPHLFQPQVTPRTHITPSPAL